MNILWQASQQGTLPLYAQPPPVVEWPWTDFGFGPRKLRGPENTYRVLPNKGAGRVSKVTYNIN